MYIVFQGQVFGAGYPSLPTMTVEEFYQQQYGASKEGGGGGGEGGDPEGGEEGEEDESEVALKKAREWDDFKDGKCIWYSRYMSSCVSFPCTENRRGWGNKRNMG